MFGLGAGEILIIAVFALVFIGPKKLPELAKSLGKGLREFQKVKDEFMSGVNDVRSGVDAEIKNVRNEVKEVEGHLPESLPKENSSISFSDLGEVRGPKGDSEISPSANTESTPKNKDQV